MWTSPIAFACRSSSLQCVLPWANSASALLPGLRGEPVVLQDAVGAERVERPVLQQDVDLPAHRRRAHGEHGRRLSLSSVPENSTRDTVPSSDTVPTSSRRRIGLVRACAGRRVAQGAIRPRIDGPCGDAVASCRGVRAERREPRRGHRASKERAEDGAAHRDGRAPLIVLLGGVAVTACSSRRPLGRGGGPLQPERLPNPPGGRPRRRLSPSGLQRRTDPRGTPAALGDHDDEQRRAVHDPGAPRGKVVRARAASGRGRNVGAFRSRNRCRHHAGGLHGLPDPPIARPPSTDAGVEPEIEALHLAVRDRRGGRDAPRERGVRDRDHLVGARWERQRVVPLGVGRAWYDGRSRRWRARCRSRVSAGKASRLAPPGTWAPPPPFRGSRWNRPMGSRTGRTRPGTT